MSDTGKLMAKTQALQISVEDTQNSSRDFLRANFSNLGILVCLNHPAFDVLGTWPGG